MLNTNVFIVNNAVIKIEFISCNIIKNFHIDLAFNYYGIIIKHLNQ